MTTLQPRPPYTKEELSKLYPDTLELRQVQVILRHGERTPVSARFQNAGLPAYWPYCEAASKLRNNVLTGDSWETMTWARRYETFQRDLVKDSSDQPTLVHGPKGEIDSICNTGELTDRGRETTHSLGQRLRDLYIDKLQLLPSYLDAQVISNIRLRATPIPRALESTQQVFYGLYPVTRRASNVISPPIVQRSMQDETLFPNEGSCKRFRELAKAFADRAARRWNISPEMAYIDKKVGKYMPEDSPVVKVDSHPRLSGIMDSINATLAHGPTTRLPSEFYDTVLINNVDRICTEEWFAGYQESNEYRKLGIGALVGDVVQNMVESSKGQQTFKLSLSGCHDTTIAATIASFGAFDVKQDKWPPYTSSIAIELFKQKAGNVQAASSDSSANKFWWSGLFSSSSKQDAGSRKPYQDLSHSERDVLAGYFVRMRYNDRPLAIPFCQQTGRHLDGDETLCTLSAFKEAADSFTPKDWKAECQMNLGQPAEQRRIEHPPGVQE